MTNSSVKHHFVPQSLLKNFSVNGEGRQIHVFDKNRCSSFLSSLRDAGSENNFNTVEVNGEKTNFEILFQNVDNLAPSIINKIINQQCLSGLSDQDRKGLALITATQFQRTKLHRTTPVELVQQLLEKLEKAGVDLQTIENLDKVSDNDSRLVLLNRLLQQDNDIESFLSKRLILLKAPSPQAFWISDNPVVLYNTFPYGECGLNTMGIEIYFPISSSFCVAFYCPSLEIKLKEALSKRTKDRTSNGNWLERIYTGLITLKTVDAISTTVDFINELQILSSSRFLYSNTSDFSLAQQVLRRFPQYQNVKSLYNVGELGSPPPTNTNFPHGEYLVVYGTNNHHILAIKDISDETTNPGIQFFALDLEKLQAIHQDSPFKSVSLYRDGQQLKFMRDAEFENIDYSANQPIRVKHREDSLNQLWQPPDSRKK